MLENCFRPPSWYVYPKDVNMLYTHRTEYCAIFGVKFGFRANSNKPVSLISDIYINFILLYS